MSNKKVGGALCCAAGCMAILALPFIVCDLFYAYQNTICVLFPILDPYVSFPLKTWLKVSGYTSLVMVLFLFLVAAVECLTPKGLILFLVYTILTAINSLFQFAWLIVGAVMFWGFLHKNHLCDGYSVNGYMWARLILGFIAVYFNLVSTLMQRNKAKKQLKEVEAVARSPRGSSGGQIQIGSERPIQSNV